MKMNWSKNLLVSIYFSPLIIFEYKSENFKIKKVQVRVGQAVDVVAQAGKPRAITGFQTHSTPVLLGYGERAELADDDCKF